MKMDWPSEANADMVALRNMRRDSMFLKSRIDVDRLEHGFDVVVRNVSAGGLLADTTMDLCLGDSVKVELRHVGSVPGRVVWTQAGRFGVAFDVTIDPVLVRQPVTIKKSPTIPKGAPPQFVPRKRIIPL